MEKIPVWIDTDTGVDDALALIVAAGLEQLDIVGVSAVAGNTTLDNAFRNARDVLSLIGREDIPVYKGADKPLVKQLHTAERVHGSNGLGDASIPASKAPESAERAADKLYEAACRYSKELTVCAIGPLTNIAQCLITHPDLAEHVKEINMMGGALDGGNITPCAEFNVYTDPEAAECIFRSDIKVNMFGLDVTLKALLNDDDIKEISSYDSPVSRLFEESNKLLYAAGERRSMPGLCEHDACPIVYTAHPDWFKGQQCAIYVETGGKIATGKTVSDLWTDFKFPDRHCQAFTDLDNDRFKTLIKEIYRTYQEDKR